MNNFTITVQDEDVQAALKVLADRVQNAKPFLQALGEDITERTKHRFDTSTGPDGVKWKPNAPSTLGMLQARLGAGHRTKSGDLNKKGLARMAGKKPLIEHGELRRQIIPEATADSLLVSATPLYAAIQQFGGQAGRGHKVNIPARPFLPVYSDGSLYPQEQALILASLNEYIADLPF